MQREKDKKEGKTERSEYYTLNTRGTYKHNTRPITPKIPFKRLGSERF